MLRAFIQILIKFFIALLGIAALILFLPRFLTGLFSLNRIYHSSNVPSRDTAIIFGAGLWRDGSPTPVLRDRVKTASDLYFSGKVDRLIMSGTSSGYYNEPKAMSEYAIELGVPANAIIQDFAGLRTYDTCYRARYIYGIEQATLVTQNFHLPRAIYLCSVMGVDANGVPADLQAYRKRSTLWWNLREIPATLVALWEVHVSQPKPVLSDLNQIPIEVAQ